jgi:hypothetical protein
MAIGLVWHKDFLLHLLINKGAAATAVALGSVDKQGE